MGRLVTVADGRTPVPGLEKSSRFHDLFSAPVHDGLVAFVASGSSEGDPEGFSGVYYSNLGTETGKTLHAVVDTDSQMEGLFAGSFTRFAIFPSVFEKSVAFVGYAADGYVGVFLYRTDRDELFLLCDNRTELDGKRVKDFEIAGHFLVRNRFAISAEFEDNTFGVYMATIPARSFKRMAAAAK